MPIFKKDINHFFMTPLGPLLTAAVVILSSFILHEIVNQYQQYWLSQGAGNGQGVSFSTQVLLKYYGNLNFLFVFLVPLIIMKVYAEEWSRSTSIILDASPFSDERIFAEKFLACVVILLFTLAVCFVPFSVIFLSGMEEFTFVWTGLFALILNTLFYSAVSLLIATLIRNSLLGVFFSIGTILLFWLLSWTADSSSFSWGREFFSHVGVLDHFRRISQGVLETRDIAYYLTFTAAFFYLAVLFERSKKERL